MENLNNCYIEPSKKVFKELKKLGYTPYNKDTFKNAIKKNHMLCIIKDIIYHRPLEECENLQRIEFSEEKVINNTSQNKENIIDIEKLQAAIKYMGIKKENDKKKYSDFEFPENILSNVGFSLFLSKNIHTKVKDMIKKQKNSKPKVISALYNNGKLSFYKPTYYCEFSAIKIDPETEDDIIIGFVIDSNQMILKKWSLLGQDLTDGTHNLKPFDLIIHQSNKTLLEQLEFSLSLCHPSNINGIKTIQNAINDLKKQMI